MGRNPAILDTSLMLDLLADGMNKKEVADIIGCSPPTISAKIAELREDEASLLAYDKNKYLDLIGVQQRILANVTDEKLAEAPVQHLASAYSNFGKMLQLDQGKPTEIHGLMGYLMKLEQEDIAKKEADNAKTDVIDVSPTSTEPIQLELEL
jgi:predicted transcriptional regulator